MKQVSDKRLAQLKEYTVVRKAFLAQMICEVCRNRRAAEVHHKRGRQGKLLLNREFWLAVCWTCHRKIHDDPAWARSRGYRS